MSPATAATLSTFGSRALSALGTLARHDGTGLRILLWHDVSGDSRSRGTSHVEDLERQLRWLRDNRYAVLPFSEVLRRRSLGTPLPRRAVVLTFDDACASFPRLALPCLQRAGFSATVLVPVSAVRTPAQNGAPQPGHMSLAELETLPGNVEVGLHSFEHLDYRNLDEAQIASDIRLCTQLRQQLQRPVLPVFAYPYGGVPRDPVLAERTSQYLASHGIELALRIGYGINPWPLRDPWRVRRITVHGTDSFMRFVCKLTFGRARL